MSTRTIKAYRQGAYVRLARKYEEFGRAGSAYATEFTCIAVSCALGPDERDYYAAAFGFSGYGEEGSSAEKYLWTRSDKTATNLRVLMLCFAAAMVATGDL